MTTDYTYFSRLLPQLSERSRDAFISRLGFSHVPLYQHLHRLFSSPLGETGCFLADPTFEAVFGWKQQIDTTMGELAGNLLCDTLVHAMDNPPDQQGGRCQEKSAKKRRENHPYRFGRDRHPYEHQLRAWKTLIEPEQPQSLIVASGTGSGKTECFMVPILDQLARESETAQRPLQGVRALFLYPLNALINSQRERLRAWTDFSGGKVRFCLYNGNTPDKVKAEQQRAAPSEVQDRETLRKSPPPILLTNATMLEYMLVRDADGPILEKSQGQLRWVVLDEAHTYVGSQAAELSLLIRRVLHAFGVRPEQVHFVATSATIGDPNGEAGEKLKRFLADVAGVPEERVHLVAGDREIPSLPKPDPTQKNIKEPSNLPETQDFLTLASHPTTRRIRRLFTEREGPAKIARLNDVCKVIYGDADRWQVAQQRQALQWLDLLSASRDDNGEALLPLRAHLFHQTLSGIWACANPVCEFRNDTSLDHKDWPFGTLYLEPRKACRCGAPVYELAACDDCGEPHLLAAERGDKLQQRSPWNAIDEFELDLETEESTEQEQQDSDDVDEKPHGEETDTLVVNRPGLEHCEQVSVDIATRRILERPDEDSLQLIVQSDDGGGLICPCCSGKGGKRKLMQEARIGAPFALSIILPTLLEFAPDEPCKPAELPYRGRRLLTFNDSRQGTARMAARLQQESERSRVRGLVYHLALQHGRKESNALIEKLSADNNSDKKLLEIVHEPAARDHIEERIVERLKNIAEQSKSTPIPFNEMVRLLAEQGQDFTQMLSHYREDISQESFGGPQGALSLANMFLVREFARRPKRLNNLESMGLVAVQYPALDVISKPHPPFTLEEWRSFLKIVLDFFVRGGGTLFIDQPTRKWLGMRIPQTWLVPMDRAELDRGERRWPRAVYRLKGGDKRPNDRSLLVRLLANVLHADIETPTGEDRVDDVLRAAWKALTEETRILQAQEGGRRVLPLDALAFGSITEAWICPVTRRILDTTLRGVTPYLSNRPTNANSVCRSIELPLYDEPMGGDSGPMAQIERAREWLGNQDTIQQLTREGLWSIVNDRAIELAPYYTAAEHSAQQPSHLLDRYEREFKDGQLNLLSCSTTMEMGIDIGGISMVAMNNVPPHPANYLQRAGRAGRRREARSLSFTLCKSNPHDQIVFSNTAWPFESKLPAPSVALSSEIIVQRHINSLVLSYFLKDVVKRSGQDASKLTSGWFFASPDPSPIQQLIDMCMGDTELAHPLSEGLKQVIVGSLFAGQSPEALVRSTAAHLESVREHWMGEWEAILRQEDEFVGDPDNLALKAIRIQKQRMDGEYLLRELADQGFLPAYGFPTHIAAFENLTAHQTKQIKFNEERKGRDDNRYQRRELANRDSVTALREYAPGAQIVMNGLVYRSAGITLNWKVPASERDSKELLSIRHAWRCHHCGANGSSAAMEESLHCDECGTPTKEENRRQFMEPAGFSVDFYEDPGNDVSTQDFIPVEPPWIHAEGEWLPLPNPSLGRFRVSNRGHIFNHSGGLHGNGYAICLECGRAEPLDSDGKAKRFDNPHYKLRGEKNQDNKREPCPGSLSDWKIKRPIALGTEGYTDVLELQLANETGVWLNHNSTALTLAVALRDALAELLGVRADELSCTTKPASVDGESPRRSILIFDRYAAGYASSAERFIERLFEQAAKRLECSKECDSACPHCVLDFDQRFLADSLDRHKAKEFLTEDWLNNLSLPKELRIFGKESKMEYADLAGAIFREARASGQVTLRLFGDCREADLGLSPIRQLAYRLAASDTPVQILCEEKGFAELDETDRHLLASMADSPNISIMAIPSLPVANGGRALAEIIKSDGTAISWGVSGDDCLSMNEHWGKHRPLIVANQQNAVALHCQLIEGDALRPEPPDVGDREIEIHHELDGKLQNFGEKFWDLVRNRHPASDQLLSDSSKDVIAIRYSDRYLFTPLAVGLLVNLIEGLRDIVSAGRWASPKIEVVTTNTPSGAAKAPARTLWSNWPDLTVRNLATEAAFDYIDMQCDLHIASKMQAPHGRILELRFSTNEMLSIRLDQGVSYWRAKTTNRNRAKPTFDFHADEIEQAERLCSLNLEIEGALHPTQLFAKVDKSIA